MWLSTQSTNGNIGGVNGATTICEMDASTSAPIAGLTHRAVIATSSNDPRDYFSNNPPVQRPDGTVIADSYADFFDPAVTISNKIAAASVNIWTGLERSTGLPHNTSNCQSWSSNASTDGGQHGVTYTSRVGRYADGEAACNSSYRLLCISY